MKQPSLVATPERDDESDDSLPPKPPNHTDFLTACELHIIYLQSYPNTQKYFPYVNSMEQFAIHNQYKCKTQITYCNVSINKKIDNNHLFINVLISSPNPQRCSAHVWAHLLANKLNGYIKKTTGPQMADYRPLFTNIFMLNMHIQWYLYTLCQVNWWLNNIKTMTK